jgi:hypothetical protein
MVMCLPGFQMQGVDHLYLFLYPALQYLIGHQSLGLYLERFSATLQMTGALIEDKYLLLTARSNRSRRTDPHVCHRVAQNYLVPRA